MSDPASLRLKILLRPKTRLKGRWDELNNCHSNHFVRLTPNSARRLRDIALSIVPTCHPIPPSTTGTSTPTRQSLTPRRQWWIHHQCSSYNESQLPVSTKCESGIEFLPLEITLESTGEIIYASYNGGNLNFHNDDQLDNNDTHSILKGK
jgi:hypothetical protein